MILHLQLYKKPKNDEIELRENEILNTTVCLMENVSGKKDLKEVKLL